MTNTELILRLVLNHRWTMRILLLPLLTCFAMANFAAAQDRYVVTWKDGKRSTAAEIQEWGTTSGNPTLAGRHLFDGASSARTIVNTTLPRTRLEPPYLELDCGDRLSGRVVEYHDRDELSGLPAHLIVEPTLSLEAPKLFARPQIRVRASAVRQIVVQSITSELSPKMLQTAQGQRESFRSLRLRTSGIDVLTTLGEKHFSFADLAAIKLEPPNSWDAWFGQLAILSPTLASPLVRMELLDGSQLTTSRERLRPITVGGDGPEHWFHLCQPAWSLDLLAVAHRQVRLRTIIDAVETPLSNIAPVVSHGEGIILPLPTKLHVNESLRGGVFRLGGSEMGWGFAVHAPFELAFDLPPSARRFQTKLALDPLVGDGGCARGMIRQNGKPLFDGPLLIGSKLNQATSDVAVIAGRLTLIADPAVNDRPQGADPFDIRDDLQWLEPLVEHGRPELVRAVQRQYAAVHPSLAGWSLDPAEAGQWRLVNRLDEVEPIAGGFRQAIELDGPLTITRRFNGQSPSALHMNIGRSLTFQPLNITVWIGANRLARQSLPEWTMQSEPLQIEVPLPPNSGKSLEVTIRLSPGSKSTQIDWQGAAIK